MATSISTIPGSNVSGEPGEAVTGFQSFIILDILPDHRSMRNPPRKTASIRFSFLTELSKGEILRAELGRELSGYINGVRLGIGKRIYTEEILLSKEYLATQQRSLYLVCLANSVEDMGNRVNCLTACA